MIENIARVVVQCCIKKSPILIGCRVRKTEEVSIGEVYDLGKEFVQGKVIFDITFNA